MEKLCWVKLVMVTVLSILKIFQVYKDNMA